MRYYVVELILKSRIWNEQMRASAMNWNYETDCMVECRLNDNECARTDHPHTDLSQQEVMSDTRMSEISKFVMVA